MPPKKRTRATRKKSEDQEETKSKKVVSESPEPPKKRTRGTKKSADSKADEKENTQVPVKKLEESDNEPASPSRRESARKPALLLDSIKTSSTPLSPSKRLSSINSRIPSPLKKKLNSKVSETLDLNRAQSSTLSALHSKNLPKLTSIIDDLRTGKQEQIFDNYKNSIELKLQAANELITSLSLQNDHLQQELQDTRTLLESESKQGQSSAPSQANEQDFLENELILDMLEQIVGLRIHKVDDTEEALSFDCSQTGKNGVLDYRLTIFKQDSSEIIYSPVPSEEEDHNVLTDYLPDYFFDDLTFPLDTLQQFYHKIYRGLNK